MEFKDRLKQAMENKNATAYAIGENTIVSKQNVMGYLKQGIQPSIKFASALAEYLEVDVDWLFNGKKEEVISKNYEQNGSPYYDVDFIGGFDLVVNDQTVNPEYYINLPPYNRPGIVWCNLYGKSMEPYVFSGDRIALKEISVDSVVFGKVYGVITKAKQRTVKWIVRSPKKGCYRLVPENKDPKFGDYQDILISDIFKIFELMGAVRAF